MKSLPKCGELPERVGGWEWVDMMVLYCHSFAAEDEKFSRRINVLLREMVAASDDRVDFIQELECVSGVVATVKKSEFFNKKLWKDDRRLQKLRIIKIYVEEMAVQNERFIKKL
nr:hypothetical protein [Tanacetum cinerariifolium]